MLRKHYINQKKLLKIFPFLIVIFLYLYNRINYIQQVHLISYVSNDFLESERALNSLINGENPYTYTINSYDYSETKIVNADHGFAYFPLFLYTLLPLKFIAPFLDTSLFALSRVIVLIADIVCVGLS